MKIFGAALIVCSFIYGGSAMSRRLYERVLFWDGFINSLEVIRTEICFSHSDIKTAFMSASRIGGPELFSAAAKNIESVGIEAAWSEAVNAMGFNGQDTELLLLFSSKIGKTDEEGQLRHIDHISALASKVRDSAGKDYVRRGMLYRRGAVLIGVFTVIILL